MNLLRSELRKLLTTRVWIALLALTVVFGLLQPTFLLAFAGQPDSGLPARTDPLLQLLALQGPSSAITFTLVLGVIGLTQEYRHRTATPTFLTTPARWKVVAAKFVLYLLVGVVYAAITAVFVYTEVAIWVGSAGGSVPLSGDNLETLLGAAGAAALFGIVGVGVGALVRNQVAAIVVGIAWLQVVEPILSAIPSTADVYRFLPGGAARAIYTLAEGPGRSIDLLTRWEGVAVLTAYGVVFAVLGTVLSVRRDVVS